MKVDMWMCPYCNSKYLNERQANRCADNCAVQERDAVMKLPVEVCDFCGDEDCVKDHEGKQDKHWLKYCEKLKVELLLAEAKKPGQVRLEVFKDGVCD